MLQLKTIVKRYGSGDNAVMALNGVSISFRESEFVAILGHSGCGKTTLLNIIGGLDHYSAGDLIINGVSTKDYKDRDWDAYRNHSIGFIFQSYNLIPHQTVLSNVELALTISGVSKSERRKRAKEALEKVGLGDQLHKKPNQMSGGQMQRVAIARALINNPDILLADEPTGALDSETSIQVMELLKEIAKDKLVIMVTHNPELAEQYANRIVKIKDGKLTSDSNPYKPEEEKAPEKEAKKKRVSMSFPTAVSLSLNNLLTKKGRTILTAFAGSIGIIGIALILALSTGINEYINKVQEETLSSYPLDIARESTDTSALLETMMDSEKESQEHFDQRDRVYANTASYDMFNSFNSSAKQINNMRKFKEFVDGSQTIQDKSTAISYSYDLKMPVYTEEPSGDIVKVDFMDMYMDALGMTGSALGMGSSSMADAEMSMFGLSVFQELLPADNGDPVHDLILDQYDVVYGEWPDEYNEVVVVLTRSNEIPDIMINTLGLKDRADFKERLLAATAGETVEDYGQTEWSYDEIMSKRYKVLLPSDYYQKAADSDTYTDIRETSTGMDFLYNSDDVGIDLKIVGFVRLKDDAKASAAMLSGYVCYTHELTDYIIEKTEESDIVKAQLADETVNVIDGSVFPSDEYEGLSDAQKADSAKAFISSLSAEKKADVFRFVTVESEVDAQIEAYLAEFDRDEFIAQMNEMYSAQLGGMDISSYVGTMSDEEIKEMAAQGMRAELTAQIEQAVSAQLAEMSNQELAAALEQTPLTQEMYVKVFDEYTPEKISEMTYDDVLKELGYADKEDPSHIYIYAKTFADKDDIEAEITSYNNSVKEADVIHYTDIVKLLTSSITGIISGISYLLIAFVGISLVVSSIMIGIITYVSVLERTKEIGILRAIGASKKDVSRVFNAETVIVGFFAGVFGVLVTLLLTVPINIVIHSLTGINTLSAQLPLLGAVILIAVSVLLTLIAGQIPSKIAARKDPVEALRTE
ncbi:MAG: ABC transporter ATP-binding protein/permease [Ruminococcus sp.]|nr:ABC transporter ATP-binding protein/permease [Ruminococcus sp.]